MTDKRASLRQYFAEQEASKKQQGLIGDQIAQLKMLSSVMADTHNLLVQFLAHQTLNVEVQNQLESIKTPDVAQVVDVINKFQQDFNAKKTDYKPILDLLAGIQSEMAKIPKELPTFEQNESVNVTNLKDIQFDTSGIEKLLEEAIKKLDVKAPVVNVEKTDYKPLQGTLSDILVAVKANKPEKLPEKLVITNLGEIKPTDTTNIEKKLDESNKQLKVIAEKKFGSSGGGGNGTPYTDIDGKPMNVVLNPDGSIPISGSGTVGGATETTLARLVKTQFTGDVSITKTVAAPLTTYVKTGITNTAYNTQTIVINATTGGTTKIWSTV